MVKRVLVFAEQREGRFRKSAFEAVGLARTLGEEVHAVLVGDGVAALAPRLGDYGATAVHTVEDARLALYWSEGYAAAMAQAIEVLKPELVLLIATAMGKDLAARVAARCQAALLTDCISLELKDGALQAVKSMYGGKVFAALRATRLPAVATVRPNVFAREEAPKDAEIVPLSVDFAPTGLLTKVLDVVCENAGIVSLEEASVIVAGGRGVGSAEGFAPLEELAELLGGAVGCSRVVTGNGWRPHTEQVGQTGTKVAPDLYIAAGISGATQHIAGCRNAKTMIVINNDPEAAIMGYADYAVIGDLHKILPAIIEETRKATAG